MPRSGKRTITKPADSTTLSNGRTFRALPGSSGMQTEAELWLHAMDRGMDLLRRLHAAKTLHGDKWVRKMKAYYGGRIDVLLEQRPPGVEREARVYLEEINYLKAE